MEDFRLKFDNDEYDGSPDGNKDEDTDTDTDSESGDSWE